MIPRTGTIVSLTGNFFPSQVRLVERGATNEEEEELDDFMTEVYSNDKPYGVKVIIPDHLADTLPDPDTEDTDRVYFVHVMGHHFEAAVFDPVNPLQPFSNHGRMHINAIYFDIARCMLPTDLYSIYASEGRTISYSEIANFCNSCRNINIHEELAENNQRRTTHTRERAESIISDSYMNYNSLNNSTFESSDDEAPIVFRKNKHRTRIESFHSSGSSSVKVSSDEESSEDDKHEKWWG